MFDTLLVQATSRLKDVVLISCYNFGVEPKIDKFLLKVRENSGVMVIPDFVFTTLLF